MLFSSVLYFVVPWCAVLFGAVPCGVAVRSLRCALALCAAPPPRLLLLVVRCSVSRCVVPWSLVLAVLRLAWCHVVMCWCAGARLRGAVLQCVVGFVACCLSWCCAASRCAVFVVSCFRALLCAALFSRAVSMPNPSTRPAKTPPPLSVPMGTVAYGGKGQGKGKGRGEGRLGQGGRGRSKGGEKLMGTTAYGGKGSKGRAVNGDRPVGAASCRRDHHTMASCQNPPLRAPADARVMWPLSILSPCLGPPRAGSGKGTIPPSFGPPKEARVV